jgi:UDP-glucose 4-epimerase
MPDKTRRKAVITGGAGFIGSHIAEGLLERGYKVVVIDDLSSGRMENILPFMSGGDLEFIHGSVTEPDLLIDAFKDAEYVFHEAAIPSVSGSIKNPIASNKVSTAGTLNVLIAARDNHVKKVVYASSSAVYGDSPALPKREDMLPTPVSLRYPSWLRSTTASSSANIRRSYGMPRYFQRLRPQAGP